MLADNETKLFLARFRGRRNGGNAPRHGKRVHLSGWDLISACQRFLRRTEPGASRIGSHPDRSILRHVRVLFGYLPLAVRTRGSKTGLSFLALLYFEAGSLLGTRGVLMEKVDSRRQTDSAELSFLRVTCKKTTIYTCICARQGPARAVRCRSSLAKSQRTCQSALSTLSTPHLAARHSSTCSYIVFASVTAAPYARNAPVGRTDSQQFANRSPS